MSEAGRDHPSGWCRHLVVALSLSACASVDAGPDLRQAAMGVAQRTGQDEALDPGAGLEAIDGAVSALLVDGLTVDEAVRVALLQNPALRSRYQEVGIRKAELVAAGLPPDPFVSVSGRFPEGGGLTNLTSSVSFGLMDLFLIPARKRAGRARLSMARWQVVRDAVQLAGEVKAESFELLSIEEGMEVAREALELSDRSLEIARDRQDAGLGDAVDVSLASGAVLDAKAQLVELERDRGVRRAVLQELLGLSSDEAEWHLVGTLPAREAVPDPETLVQRALATRLDVAVAELEVSAAKGDLDVERTNRIPGLNLGVERERAESPPTLTGPVVAGSIPIWGGRRPAVMRGRFLVSKAEADLEGTRNRVAREVREAWAVFSGSRRLVDLFETEILPRSTDGLEVSQRAFRAGERGIGVVLDAQRLYLEQRRRYVDAIRRLARARAALEVAVGGWAERETNKIDTERP